MFPPNGQLTTTLLVGGFLFLLALAGLLVLLAAILLIRRQRAEKDRDEAWERMQTEVHLPDTDKNHACDNWEPGRDAFGFLTVLCSDDRSKIGLHFELTQPCTTLGRSKDNNIHFPHDSLVSRHHAKIELDTDGVYLSEIISVDGVRPRFGTFVNQASVMSSPVPLKSGDVIRLGKRLQVKFQSLIHQASSDEKTYVAFASPGRDTGKATVKQVTRRSDQPVTRDTDI
jgi:hypothetical protein